MTYFNQTIDIACYCWNIPISGNSLNFSIVGESIWSPIYQFSNLQIGITFTSPIITNSGVNFEGLHVHFLHIFE